MEIGAQEGVHALGAAVLGRPALALLNRPQAAADYRDRDTDAARMLDPHLPALRALGFAPAITERAEDLPVYWLDYAIAADSPFDWRQRLPDLLDIEQREAQCF